MYVCMYVGSFIQVGMYVYIYTQFKGDARSLDHSSSDVTPPRRLARAIATV